MIPKPEDFIEMKDRAYTWGYLDGFAGKSADYLWKVPENQETYLIGWADGKGDKQQQELQIIENPILEVDDFSVLGYCSHGVDLDRNFCPEGCRV